jgi:predicted branched-subunit amino acid permease
MSAPLLLETAAPPTGRASARAGAGAALPLVAGLAPFGLAVGATVAASADPVAGWAATLLVFGGSAHLTLLELLGTGAPLWAAVVVPLLVNARLAVYSASLAPLFAGRPLRTKLLGAAAVVDPTWAVAEQRRRAGGAAEGALAHYAGAAGALAAGWTAAVTAGTLLGRVDGAAAHLALAVPLCLVVLVVPHLRLPGGVAAVTAAAGTAVTAAALLPGSEVLLGMAAAALAGGLAGRSTS